MKIESEKTDVNNSAEKTFNFLSDFNNFQKLMPPQVTNWQSTADECSFTISGMASLGMKIVSKTPNSEIKIISNGGKIPFTFNLNVLITEAGENKCVSQLVFESDMNPMLKMMVEKPLGNFFNLLASRMKELSL